VIGFVLRLAFFARLAFTHSTHSTRLRPGASLLPRKQRALSRPRHRVQQEVSTGAKTLAPAGSPKPGTSPSENLINRARQSVEQSCIRGAMLVRQSASPPDPGPKWSETCKDSRSPSVAVAREAFWSVVRDPGPASYHRPGSVESQTSLVILTSPGCWRSLRPCRHRLPGEIGLRRPPTLESGVNAWASPRHTTSPG